MTTKAIYIYGIIPNLCSIGMFRSLENTSVYAIPYQNISAIVSDRERELPDFSDRESLGRLLVNHQNIIEGLMEKGLLTIVPMKLGTIAKSIDEVLKILTDGYDLFAETLKKLEHLTEIDIAVSWANFPSTLNQIADDPEIIAMKEDIMKKKDTILHIDQVKVGMMLQTKLREKNFRIELNILDALAPLSIDIKTHELMNDQMITNSAFLLNRNNKELFECTIDNLDKEYKGFLNFKLIGPLSCYSFYTMEVKELNPEHIAQAQKELGLREEITEPEIKKAYLEKAKLFHPDTMLENGAEKNFNKISNAYKTLLEYSAAARQYSPGNLISLAREKVINNLILIKIKD